MESEALAHLQQEAWREGFRGLLPVPAPPVEHLAAGIQDRSDDPGAGVLVVEEGGEPRGFATLGPSRYEPPPVGEVYMFFVHPRHWRRGVGRALMGAALDELRRLRCEEATLWSLAENDRASRFYEALGLERDGATQRRPAHGNALEVRYRIRL